MLCRHCDNTIDETRLFNKILCHTCAEKALHILPTDSKERLHIYNILLESENPIVVMCIQQLMKEDIEIVEQLV